MKKLFLSIPFLLTMVACSGGPSKPTLRIVTDAEKMTYSCGENFDPTGLEIEKVNTDGTTEKVTDFEIVDGNNLKTSSVVSATYDGLYIDLPVEIEPLFKGQITCVGDSLTAGQYWPNEAYPTFINSFLPEGSNAKISNCGVNGASFKTFGQYNPAYNTTDGYKTSLTGNPAVITILLGTNDATNWANEANDFVDDYKNLVNEYQTKFGEDVNIVMITSPKCTTNSFGIPSDTIVNIVNPLQRELAEELELPLIDLSAEVQDMENSTLFRDGVHLSVDAAKLVANLIAKQIAEIYEFEIAE